MAHNPLRSKPLVIIPDRPAPSKAQKVRVWNRENGVCYRCGKPVALEGPNVDYDHRMMRKVSGDDSDANLFPTHRVCHAVKTAKLDLPLGAKVDRQEAMTMPKRRKPGGLSHPTLKRKMDGSVVRR